MYRKCHAKCQDLQSVQIMHIIILIFYSSICLLHLSVTIQFCQKHMIFCKNVTFFFLIKLYIHKEQNIGENKNW